MRIHLLTLIPKRLFQITLMFLFLLDLIHFRIQIIHLPKHVIDHVILVFDGVRVHTRRHIDRDAESRVREPACRVALDTNVVVAWFGSCPCDLAC
jgi:hypothetical protein